MGIAPVIDTVTGAGASGDGALTERARNALIKRAW